MYFTNILAMIISVSSHSSDFCGHHQMGNLVRLAETVQELYTFDVTDMSTRRKRHAINLNSNVLEFYAQMSSRLSIVSHDISILSNLKYESVNNIIKVMIELMNDGISLAENNSIKKLSNHRNANFNEDIIKERIYIFSSKILENFLSVKIQCNF
jgi:hypothetical protein